MSVVGVGADGKTAIEVRDKTVHGWAHVLTAYDNVAPELRPDPIYVGPDVEPQKIPRTAEEAQALKNLHEKNGVEQGKPNPDLTWWNLGSGLSLDYIEKLHGRDELYNKIVRDMVARGYLPPEAVGTSEADGISATAATPWDFLKTLDVTGMDLNKTGKQYDNWRQLVTAMSMRSMRITCGRPARCRRGSARHHPDVRPSE